MKYLALFILIFVSTFPVQAQIKVKGLLLESSNCDDIGNAGSLAHVTISADGANQTSTNTDGSFTLFFPNKKPGNQFTISVTKAGYILVKNKGIIRDDPNVVLEFIMCTQNNYDRIPNSIKALEAQLAQLSVEIKKAPKDSQVYKELQKEIVEIQERLKRSQQKIALGEKTIEELTNRIENMGWQTIGTQLIEKLRNATIPDLIDNEEFSLDESFINDFLNLLWDGFTPQQLDSLSLAGDFEEQKQKLEVIIKALFYSIDLQFENAEKSFRLLTELEPNNAEFAIQYANILSILHRIAEARKELVRALEIQDLDKFSKTTILSQLAQFSLELNEKPKAKKYLHESHQGLIRLLKTDTSDYLAKRQLEAKILSIYGALHFRTHQYDEAIQKYKQSIHLLESLPNSQKQLNSDLANVHASLGNLYATLNAYNQALNHLDNSQRLYEKLVESGVNLSAFQQYDIALDIANLYFTRNDFKTAEILYADLGNKFRSMVPYYPDQFREYLARVNYAEGRMAHQKRQYLLAEQKFGEAIRIYIELENRGVGNYVGKIANALNAKGWSQFAQKKRSAAKSNFDQARSKYRSLITKDRTSYEPELAATYSHLGSYFFDLKLMDSARFYFEESLLIFEKYDEIEPRIYRPDLIKAKQDLGRFYFSQGQQAQARKELDGAIEMSAGLVKLDSLRFLPNHARTIEEHGTVFLTEEEYEVAIQKFKESLSIYKRLSREQVEAYELQKANILWKLGELHTLIDPGGILALRYLDEAQKICVAEEEGAPSAYRPILGKVYFSKAQVNMNQKEYPEANDNLMSADNIYKALYSSTDLEEYQHRRGAIQLKKVHIHIKNEEFGKAGIASDEARRIFTMLRENSPNDKATYNEQLALIERGAAEINLGRGKFHDALGYLKSARTLYHSIRESDFPKYHIEECYILMKMGVTQMKLNLKSQAVNSFRVVIQEVESSIEKNPGLREEYLPLVAEAYGHLGDFFINSSPEEGLSNYNKSLNIYQVLDKTPMETYNYEQSLIRANMAVYYSQRDPNTAIKLFQEALLPFKNPNPSSLQDIQIYLIAHRGLGYIYRSVKDFELASLHFEKCLKVKEQQLTKFTSRIEYLWIQYHAAESFLYADLEEEGENRLISLRSLVLNQAWTSEENVEINKMLGKICELIACE